MATGAAALAVSRGAFSLPLYPASLAGRKVKPSAVPRSHGAFSEVEGGVVSGAESTGQEENLPHLCPPRANAQLSRRTGLTRSQTIRGRRERHWQELAMAPGVEQLIPPVPHVN